MKIYTSDSVCWGLRIDVELLDDLLGPAASEGRDVRGKGSEENFTSFMQCDRKVERKMCIEALKIK